MFGGNTGVTKAPAASKSGKPGWLPWAWTAEAFRIFAVFSFLSSWLEQGD